MSKEKVMSVKQNTQFEILYFAKLKEEAKLSSELFHLPSQGTLTLEQLYSQLQSKYQFTLNQKYLRVARNHEFTVWNQKIQAGDCIAFIPPVSGG